VGRRTTIFDARRPPGFSRGGCASGSQSIATVEWVQSV
jgi:hypothetical protein